MRSFLLLLLFVSPLHAEWQNLWPQYFLNQPNAKKNNGSGSRDNLLGKNPPAELLEKLSTEKALWQAGLICLMLG